MLLERPIHADIKNMLIANKPFQYAHLIKFERPSRPDSLSGTVSTSKERYTYLTDASRDVAFDDGSTNASGGANGMQNYIANKVLKVSAVSEDTEVKASAFTLTLDGNSIGASVFNQQVTITSVNPTSWDIAFPSSTDLLRNGFREGDKVTLSGYTAGSVNIQKFRAANIIRVVKIDDTLTTGTGLVNATLSSDEIVSILLDKNAVGYSSFVNREVFIYRAYFQNGAVVGTPFLLFKGIISAVSFDDGDAALTVSWTLTSHWGDFSQVRGRLTSDDFHRALDQNGVPQPASALKVAYAYDKGFSHAETSVHILANYTVQVEKQDVKAKNGFFGIGAKVKVKKYLVDETRNTELDFQLQAKAVPVIYGVRNTAGIPVFADTLNNDSSNVYVVYALSEGEVGGIYDVYINDNSLICNDKGDFDTRSTQTTDNTVELVCRGRADRGDVLGGVTSTAAAAVPFYDNYYSNPTVTYKNASPYDFNWIYNFRPYVQPTLANTNTSGAGVYDGQSISLTAPQEITLDFFSGKAGQKAAASLVTIAKANNFKIQNAYWNGVDTADYWGPNHRLLDTAYVVANFKIKEGETTIPTLEFILRGKSINCYNYDKSYSHYAKATSENADNFKLGQTVQLQAMDGTYLVVSTQIIDKWTFTQADGTLNTRFRFDADPPLNYVNGVPGTTQFKMVSGSNTWTMITYNFKEVSGITATEWITPITSATNNGGFVQFTLQSNSSVGGDPDEPSSVYSVSDASGNPVANTFFGGAVLVGSVSGNNLLTKYSWDAAGASAVATVGNYMVRRNIVSLPSGSSTTADYYNGYDLTLTRIDPITGKSTQQTKKVLAYSGGTSMIATVDGLWDYGFHPKPGDIVSLTPPYADSRISINPAIQLMDYITSSTYGRGLDPVRDLNLPSWLESARTCDTQSNVTVGLSSTVSPITAGAIYKYPATGDILWQGTVVGSAGNFVEFKNILGKLSNAWNSWRTYQVGQLLYADNRLYRVSTAGIQATKPTHTSGTVSGLDFVNSGDVVLTRIGSTSSVAQLPLVADGNPVRAQKNGVAIPGYSLYDCDGVDYWRLLGWDQFDQRYVTLHQTNLSIDTSLPLLDNVNSFLQHFGGLMRYTAGQYYLDIEQPESTVNNVDTEVRNITADYIIGKIRLEDDGVRSAFNSLTASYSDPANKFDSRNISFFNSDYLKADRGVPKKGNLTVPGITNYYNTRLLSNKFLNKSRFGLTVTFNMAPRGILLLAGRVVQLQYPRYGWVNKQFRITSLNHQTDATIDVVAEEYDSSFYSLSNISRQAAAGKAGSIANITGVGSPSGLVATSLSTSDEITSAVRLTWVNSPAANSLNVSTEIYSSFSIYFYVNIASIDASSVITTAESSHGLKVGELITPTSNGYGLVSGQAYYIREIPAANKLTLTATKGGPLLTLSTGSNTGISLQTANLIATVPVPTNSYVDSFGGIDGRVAKYYWIRHRIT